MYSPSGYVRCYTQGQIRNESFSVVKKLVKCNMNENCVKNNTMNMSIFTLSTMKDKEIGYNN